MTTFLLVHGSWHGGWCWAPLIAALEQRGHRALAPDLPGMGDDLTPIAAISLAGWASFLGETAQASGGDITLVGHSRGGVVLSAAAELRPDLFRGLIYVTAILLPNGGHVMQLADHMPPEAALAITPAADGLSTVLNPAAAPDLLYNTTSAALAAWASARLGPDPTEPNMALLRVTAERFGALPRGYVECARDRTMTLQLQRQMQQALPCNVVETLDTDHSPFLSAPEALADSLCRIAETFPVRG